MNQLCAPARGEGPTPVGFWGRQAIYDFDQGLEWAEARLRQKPYALHPDHKAHASSQEAAS
jgi:hypothetical protein